MVHKEVPNSRERVRKSEVPLFFATLPFAIHDRIDESWREELI